MNEKQLLAYFGSEDEAYAASIHLQALGGVKDISTEIQRTYDDDATFPFFAMNSFSSGQGITSNMGAPGIGMFTGFMFAPGEQEAMSPYRSSGPESRVMLSCSVDPSKWEDAVAAIQRAGGHFYKP